MGGERKDPAMPQNSTSGYTNIVRNVEDEDFTFSRSDSFAAIVTWTAAHTIHLPGPNSTGAGNTPAAGDYYSVLDPFALVSAGNPLTIDGGGFDIASDSGQTATYELTASFAGEELFFIFVQPPTGPGVWALVFS
jgi:hypothetical protein